MKCGFFGLRVCQKCIFPDGRRGQKCEKARPKRLSAYFAFYPLPGSGGASETSTEQTCDVFTFVTPAAIWENALLTHAQTKEATFHVLVLLRPAHLPFAL